MMQKIRENPCKRIETKIPERRKAKCARGAGSAGMGAGVRMRNERSDNCYPMVPTKRRRMKMTYGEG
jgi:hypothetical protein